MFSGFDVWTRDACSRWIGPSTHALPHDSDLHLQLDFTSHLLQSSNKDPSSLANLLYLPRPALLGSSYTLSDVLPRLLVSEDVTSAPFNFSQARPLARRDALLLITGKLRYSLTLILKPYLAHHNVWTFTFFSWHTSRGSKFY
jgi:hypothetical protein